MLTAPKAKKACQISAILLTWLALDLKVQSLKLENCKRGEFSQVLLRICDINMMDRAVSAAIKMS